MASDAEGEQGEIPDHTYKEPSDTFDAKKLMKEYNDGRWMEDPAKVRGAILQWGKSDCMVLRTGDEVSAEELYYSWDNWLRGKLGYSWLLLKTRGDDKERMYRLFVDYLEDNQKIRELADDRSVKVGNKEKLKRELRTVLRNGGEPNVVSTPDEDEHDDAVYHVERTTEDSKLKHQIDLEPTDVPRAGVDEDMENLIGAEIVGHYPVDGVPCVIVEKGEDTYEIPLHYLG